MKRTIIGTILILTGALNAAHADTLPTRWLAMTVF
ncbi:hypothetical protein SAMN05444159_7342 [Bradyrhizobium lablabi]|uniref:Uncharacterized protein n=1 Tax=Bradyrhizobium lablabi TaxID=722472 RepID=A0A1M7F0T3_9BRAD|nr:hypothetical protein SAMN05444159_7342 [Bradyrhizobium lablabi]